MNVANIRAATAKDYDQFVALLQSENLPVADLDTGLAHFFVATSGEEIVAGIGLEYYGRSALLRSMVTAAGWRNKGLAAVLIGQLFQYAGSKGVTTIYLITNTAEKYFLHKGFHRVERSSVDPLVLRSGEFNGLCPSSAIIMQKSI